MDQIIRDHGITDNGILTSHYFRGCLYMLRLEENYDISDSLVNSGLRQMAERIDYNHVMSSPEFSRQIRDAYLRVKRPFFYRLYAAGRRLKTLFVL